MEWCGNGVIPGVCSVFQTIIEEFEDDHSHRVIRVDEHLVRDQVSRSTFLLLQLLDSTIKFYMRERKVKIQQLLLIGVIGDVLGECGF